MSLEFRKVRVDEIENDIAVIRTFSGKRFEIPSVYKYQEEYYKLDQGDLLLVYTDASQVIIITPFDKEKQVALSLVFDKITEDVLRLETISLVNAEDINHDR